MAASTSLSASVSRLKAPCLRRERDWAAGAIVKEKNDNGVVLYGILHTQMTRFLLSDSE
jgi:hypothetical protein